MSEHLTEYSDLPHDKRVEVLQRLADVAIDIITAHPDIREEDVIAVMRHQPYSYVTWLALRLAIKEGRVIPYYDGSHTTLKSASDPELGAG